MRVRPVLQATANQQNALPVSTAYALSSGFSICKPTLYNLEIFYLVIYFIEYLYSARQGNLPRGALCAGLQDKCFSQLKNYMAFYCQSSMALSMITVVNPTSISNFYLHGVLQQSSFNLHNEIVSSIQFHLILSRVTNPTSLALNILVMNQ